ncbi:hypothetical protein ACIA8O_28765 [Kitasatospora sp. NPDC051853]|uniref:hypothetical protein n=1 Tax=Kitasatospora sp. NPDC051853 TaxID=3364058 RepID=UPI0037A6ABBC
MTGRRTKVRALLALAGLVLVAQVIGSIATHRGGLVLIQELDRPVHWGAALVLLLTAAVVVGSRDDSVRSTVLIAVVVLGFLAIPAVQFTKHDWKLAERHRAPARADRELVVETGRDMIDPLWMVYLEQGSGLTERRWHLGRFNGDAEDGALVEAAWDGPDRIRIRTGDGRVQLIELAPDGTPRSRAE